MMAAAASTTLAVILMGHSEVPFRDPSVTATAVLALLLSLPLVDSVLFSGRVQPFAAGVSAGVPLGFLSVQAAITDTDGGHPFVPGVSAVLAFAFSVSCLLAAARIVAMAVRRRRSRSQST